MRVRRAAALCAVIAIVGCGSDDATDKADDLRDKANDAAEQIQDEANELRDDIESGASEAEVRRKLRKLEDRKAHV